MFTRGIALTLATVLSANPAKSDEADAKAAYRMAAAFQCSMIAMKAGYIEQQKKLFAIGHASGKRFLAAVHAGTISKEEGDANVPFFVTLMLDGPSDDFILGRMYEFASTYASDRMYKQDAKGQPLDVQDWVVDPKMEVFIAQIQYREANCELILM